MEFHGIPWNCSCRRNWRTPRNFMELLLAAELAHRKFHGIPWNSMELFVSTQLAHFKFHGIPWNQWSCSCHRNWRTPNSVEFHGIPLNSFELLVSSKLAYSQFHGIPWNCSCHRNWRIPSSTEFHGTARVIEIGAFPVPRNSMELLVSSKLAHSKFHGIPWNCSCHRNWHTPNSMELHGTARVNEIGALQILRNSMKFHGAARVSELTHRKFHGIPCHGTAGVSVTGAFLVPWNSMELLVSTKLAHFKFYGIPWNSVELLVSAKLAHRKFHRITWNCSCQRNWRILSSMEFHGTARVSEIGALQVPWSFM